MTGAYAARAAISFRRSGAYRSEHLIGLLGTVVQIFVYASIWKALYRGAGTDPGISIEAVTTSFVISLGLARAFYLDDFTIMRMVRSGDIGVELLKPVSLRGLILAENVGAMAFRIIADFLPAVAFSSLFMKLLGPASAAALALAAASALLGFFVMHGISDLVALAAFWIVNVWSLSTIKNVFVTVLSGMAIPLWFMPAWALSIIRFTPFDAIYFMPVNLYLGRLGGAEIALGLGRQLAWIVALELAAALVWSRAKRRVVVQGG